MCVANTIGGRVLSEKSLGAASTEPVRQLREATVQALGGLPHMPVCLQSSNKPKHLLPLPVWQI